MVKRYKVILFAVVVMLSACASDKGVPAYIRVNSIPVVTEPITQGSNSSNITDAWIYADDQLIGAFELPCDVPVLDLGTKKISIGAGIKINGISSLRAPYPFYKFYETTSELKAGESVTFRYRVAIAAGKTALPQTGINQLQNDFAAKPVKLMYVGSYTGKGNPGIQVYAFDQTTGKSSFVREHRNPSAGYFAITPDKKYIYSLGEEGNRKGSVWAYSIDQKTGELIKLNSQPAIGDGPCYISFDPKTKAVYCANYSGGSLTVFKTAENGSLLPAAQHIVYSGSSVNKSRQDKAHAHCAVIAPGGKYVYVNDLGADKIYRHAIKADGT
jgi:hypothetical protein